MAGILIAAKSRSSCDALAELVAALCPSPVCVTDGIYARSADVSATDVIIISTPLSDEFGLDLVAELSEKSSAAIIVLTKAEIADEVQAKIGFTGAFVISRPCSGTTLLQSIKLAQVAQGNVNRLREQTQALNRKIDDMQLINRAKLCLMQYLRLTEEQAHAHIQKQAMDLRKSAREVAEDVLRTYTN